MTHSYKVQVRGEIANDDGLAIDMGQAGPGLSAWWEVPLPACPDCGGELAWSEFGGVPGERRCKGCDSLFVVETPGGRRVELRRLRVYT